MASINGWGQTPHSTTPANVPTKRTEESMEETVLPGQKCKMRKSERAKWLSTFIPLRASVRHHYLYRAAIHGLTAFLVWNDDRFWSEIAILFDKPEIILGTPIQVERDEGKLRAPLLGNFQGHITMALRSQSYSAARRMTWSIAVSGEIEDSHPTLYSHRRRAFW